MNMTNARMIVIAKKDIALCHGEDHECDCEALSHAMMNANANHCHDEKEEMFEMLRL